MSREQIVNKIIILGGNHHNGLGLIRSLGEVDCEIYFISTSTKKSFVVKSKYIKKYWYAKDDKKLLNIILTKFKNERLKPIIFPSDDNTAEIIDQNLNLLKEEFIVPNIANRENEISKQMNKKTMMDLAERNGLTVPKSMVVDLQNIKSIQNDMKNNIIFPCIVKPLRSIDGSKEDIAILNNYEDLIVYFKEIKKVYKEVIIQEYIDKDYELSIQGFSTMKNEEVIITSIIERIRESSVAPSTTYAKIIPPNQNKEIEEIKSLVKEIKYKGIFDVDLIYSKNKCYFIEINYRNGAYGYALTKAGVNIPELWCLNAIGKNTTKRKKNVNKPLILMNEFADFKNIGAKKLSLIKWLVQFLKTDAHLIFNLKDIKPFIFKFIRR